MVKKNLVLFGANSEFARAFTNLAEKQGHSVFGISRTYIDNLDINNQFKAEQNYENVSEIEKFILNIDIFWEILYFYILYICKEINYENYS